MQPLRQISSAARASATASAIGPVHSRWRARSCDAIANVSTDPRRCASANESRQRALGRVVVIAPAEAADHVRPCLRVRRVLLDQAPVAQQPVRDGEHLGPRRRRPSSRMISALLASARPARLSSSSSDARMAPTRRCASAARPGSSIADVR